MINNNNNDLIDDNTDDIDDINDNGMENNEIGLSDIIQVLSNDGNISIVNPNDMENMMNTTTIAGEQIEYEFEDDNIPYMH